MKRIWIIILLVFFPTILFSQWSFAGSVSTGTSKVSNDYMKFYKTSKGSQGFDLAFTARYAIWKIYVSSGVGFQAYKSQSGYVMTSSVVDYQALNPEFSYSDVYVPLTIGFSHDRWKLYPVVEAGVAVNFTIESKDRLAIGNETTSRLGGANATVLSYIAQAGLGYGFNDRYSLEAKLRFSGTGNVSNQKNTNGTNYKSTWQFIGAQVSFVVRIQPEK